MRVPRVVRLPRGVRRQHRGVERRRLVRRGASPTGRLALAPGPTGRAGALVAGQRGGSLHLRQVPRLGDPGRQARGDGPAALGDVRPGAGHVLEARAHHALGQRPGADQLPEAKRGLVQPVVPRAGNGPRQRAQLVVEGGERVPPHLVAGGQHAPLRPRRTPGVPSERPSPQKAVQQAGRRLRQPARRRLPPSPGVGRPRAADGRRRDHVPALAPHVDAVDHPGPVAEPLALAERRPREVKVPPARLGLGHRRVAQAAAHVRLQRPPQRLAVLVPRVEVHHEGAERRARRQPDHRVRPPRPPFADRRLVGAGLVQPALADEGRLRHLALGRDGRVAGEDGPSPPRVGQRGVQNLAHRPPPRQAATRAPTARST